MFACLNWPYTPHTADIKEEITYRRTKYQAINMFISAVKLGILTWGWMETDSSLEPASSGHSKNCSFWHFSGIFQLLKLPIGLTLIRDGLKYLAPFLWFDIMIYCDFLKLIWRNFCCLFATFLTFIFQMFQLCVHDCFFSTQFKLKQINLTI